MKTDPLDRLLRKSVPTESPRPGFETRLQAMATTAAVSPQKNSPGHHLAWLGATACAVIAACFFFLMNPADSPSTPPPVALETPLTFTPADSLAFVNRSLMHREMKAFQSDATKTMRFLISHLPSVPKEF